VKTWNKPVQYDPSRGSVYSFIALPALSRTIDKTRSRAFKNRKKDDCVINDDEYSFNLGKDNPNPAEKIEVSKRATEVRKALARLNEKAMSSLHLIFRRVFAI